MKTREYIMTTSGVYLSSGEFVRRESLESSDAERLRDLITARFGREILGESINIEELRIGGSYHFFLRVQKGPESTYQDLNQDPEVLSLCKKIFKREVQPPADPERDDAARLRSLVDEVTEREAVMIEFYERLAQAQRAMLSLSSRESIQMERAHLTELKDLKTKSTQELKELEFPENIEGLKAQIAKKRAFQEGRRKDYDKQYEKVGQLIRDGKVETDEFRAERASLIDLINEYRTAEDEIKKLKFMLSKQQFVRDLISHRERTEKLTKQSQETIKAATEYRRKSAEAGAVIELTVEQAIAELKDQDKRLSLEIERAKRALEEAESLGIPQTITERRSHLWELQHEKSAVQMLLYVERDIRSAKLFDPDRTLSDAKIEEKLGVLLERLERVKPPKPFVEFVRFSPTSTGKKELIKEYEQHLLALKETFEKVGIKIVDLGDSLRLKSLEGKLTSLPREIERAEQDLAEAKARLERNQSKPALVPSYQQPVDDLTKTLEEKRALLASLPAKIEALKEEIARKKATTEAKEKEATPAKAPEEPKPTEVIAPPSPPPEEVEPGFLSRLATGVAFSVIDFLTAMAEAYPQSPDSPRSGRTSYFSRVVDL